MADEKTHADSLRLYLTGAASDGAAQADPDAALGNYRSSSEVAALGVTITNPISNITIVHAAARNGTGTGTLTASGASTLKWSAPGGMLGAAVTIANGETKVIEDGADPDKYIRVTRTSTDALAGTATLTLAEQLNNLVALDNISSAEALAGDDEYRCLCIRNESATHSVDAIFAYLDILGTQATGDTGQLPGAGAGTIATGDSFADWDDQGYAHVRTSAGATREIVYYTDRTATTLTVPAAGRGLLGTSAGAGAADDTVDHVPGIRIASESPTGSATTGYAQTIADEDTAPTGRTWKTGLDTTNGVSIGSLDPGEIMFLWLHRQAPAGMVADPNVYNRFLLSFDAV